MSRSPFSALNWGVLGYYPRRFLVIGHYRGTNEVYETWSGFNRNTPAIHLTLADAFQQVWEIMTRELSGAWDRWVDEVEFGYEEECRICPPSAGTREWSGSDNSEIWYLNSVLNASSMPYHVDGISGLEQIWKQRSRVSEVWDSTTTYEDFQSFVNKSLTPAQKESILILEETLLESPPTTPLQKIFQAESNFAYEDHSGQWGETVTIYQLSDVAEVET